LFHARGVLIDLIRNDLSCPTQHRLLPKDSDAELAAPAFDRQ